MVSSLHGFGSPSYLMGLTVSLVGVVTTIVVDSVNSMLHGGSSTHERNESIKPLAIFVVLMPLRTYVNTATTIVLEGHVARIIAPDVHHQPDTIFRRIVSANCLSFAATVHLWAVWTNHVVFGDIHLLATYALDAPLKAAV